MASIANPPTVRPIDAEKDPDARAVPLSNGGFSYVDKEDFDIVSSLKWWKSVNGYAIHQHGPHANPTCYRMHRFILGAVKGQMLDHINRNKLDNRRCNLRLVSAGENVQNVAVKRNNSTGYRGITPIRDGNYRAYQAVIYKNGVRYFCGKHKDMIAAAKAYDKKARELYGEHAFVNFPEVSAR